MTRTDGRPDHEDADERDLVGQYLDEIGSTPLLTAADEVELAQRIEAGLYAAERLRSGAADGAPTAYRSELEALVEEGSRAKDRMIRANLRLVVSAARRRRQSGLSLLDLIQEGNLGLIRAVEKFDYTKGYKFSTYAMWWIRQAMQRGSDIASRTVRLPSHVVGQLGRLERIERELRQELQRDPTPPEVAERAEVSVERVLELRDITRTVTSLDTPVGDDGDTELGDLIANSTTLEAADVAERESVVESLTEMLRALEPVERRIVSYRYGLEDGHQHTVQDTATRLGIPREKVRAMEQEALARMRHPDSVNSGLDLVS